MRKLIVILFTILSLPVFGQVQDTALLAGKAQFSQSGAGSGYWQVSGTFTDESGLNDAGGILAGDVLFFSDAGIGYFLPIIQVVSATPPSFTIRVSNVGITNIVSVPTTSGVIYRPSTGEYLTFTAGISNPDQQTFQSRLAKKLDELSGGDGNGIISALPLADVVIETDNTLQFKGDSAIPDSSQVSIFTDDLVFGGRNLIELNGKGTGGLAGYQSFNSFSDYGYQYHLAFNNFGDEVRQYVGAARGARNDPKALNKGDRIGGTYFWAYKAGGWRKVAVIRAEVDSIYAGANPSARIIFGATSNNSPETSSQWRFEVNAQGTISHLDHRVGNILRIGSAASNYRLPSGTTPSATANVVNIMKWTAGVPSFGPITNDYEVTITGGNTGSKLYIRSDVTGVTANYSSNLLTITIPGNGKIHSADWRMVASDVQASADAGGVTNWTTVRFVNTSHNTSIADMRCPDVTKIAIPSSGSLSASNSATYDTDNNPAVSVIDVGGNAITVRVGGLSIGTQGFVLKFTQI